MNILVLGSYGLGNIGDNVCQDILLDFLKQEGTIIKCCHPPVEKSLIKWADLVMLGGGGLLYDSGEVISLRQSNASFFNKLLRFLFLIPEVQRLVQTRAIRGILRTLPLITTNATAIVDNYMNPIETATQLGKPTAGIALGTQGICMKYGKGRYAQILSKLDLLTVRDPTDKTLLESIGVHPRNGIKAYEDLGWMIKPPDNMPIEFDIGWVIRWLSYTPKEYYQPITSAIIELKKQGFTQHIISFSRTDTSFLEKVAKNTGITFYENLDKIKALSEIAKCKMIVSNRFHATLFSLLLHKLIIVPITKHSLKSEWLLSRANLPYSFSVKPSSLADKIIEVWKEGNNTRIDISDFIDKATNNLILLRKLIRRIDGSK